MERTSGAPGPSILRRRVVVHGQVHGVGFRFACARRSGEAHLAGWVRNLSDGTVEAIFEGAPREVESLTAWCDKGPPLARVRRVEVFDEAPVGEEHFSIR
ncbi:MAG: acylphosphatase [Acidimicrobiales bacterium]